MRCVLLSETAVSSGLTPEIRYALLVSSGSASASEVPNGSEEPPLLVL